MDVKLIKLDKLQSINVMHEFLDMYFLQNRSGDLATILGGMSFILVIAHPLVPTITWGNWLKAIKITLSFEDPRNYLVLFKE